jgi:hypothetical protein
MRHFFSNRVLPAALSLSLFFFIVGTHWATFDKFGSDIPNWDQWDAEGLYLLAPYFENDHFAEHLFHPHNEHRVVITKLQNLALTMLSGQWDARLESVTNAALHAALAVGFWLAAWRWLDARWRAPLFVALAALFGAPVAWQNILGGFHSQQYWLVLLSFAAIVTLPGARAWSLRWFLGAGVSILALGTMGSGFFAAAMVLCLEVFRLGRRHTTLRAAWPTLALTLALIVVGLLTRVEVDYHQGLKARDAHDFLFTILHSLQWPAPRAYTWLALVLWLPWVITTWRVVRDPRESPAGLALVGLGGWVLAQILATAYARGAAGTGGDFPATRYMDTLALGTAVNALALGWFAQRPANSEQRPETLEIIIRTKRHSRVFGLSSLVLGLFRISWFGVFAWGVFDLAHLAIAIEMPDVKRFYVQAEAHMKGYLATSDPAQLAFENIPYPSGAGIIERLSHDSLRRRMPASIRAPLALKPAPNADPIFVENRASQLTLDTAPRRGLSPATGALASHPTWGTFGASGPGATGEWSSAPLTAPLAGWLKFETAGDLGRDGVALELRDAKTNALLAKVAPTKIPGDSWRTAYVRAPRTPFVVVARDESTARWMAFSAPVEMSEWSYVAWRCAKHGALVAEVAAATAALLGLAALLVGRARYP